MKVTFVGLSCFLLEADNGGKILLDPYKDAPEFSLGLKFPENLQADLFFVSHPDDDHSNLTSKMHRKRRDYNDKADDEVLFPSINIKGTLVKEYNGDLNIAFSFAVDGIRFLHLSDNAHELTDSQVEEIGNVDVVFISPPKVPDQQYHVTNIKRLNPRAVFVSHYIPLETDEESPEQETVRESMNSKLTQDWITNPHATGQTIATFTNMFFEGLKLKDNFDFEQVFDSSISVSKDNLSEKTKVYLFRKCLGK